MGGLEWLADSLQAFFSGNIYCAVVFMYNLFHPFVQIYKITEIGCFF